MKTTTVSFQEMKERGEAITMVTAYDYTTAKIVDEAGIDSILVGDSLGMVMLGYEDTVSVTVEDMIHHSKAVARGAKNALRIVDMPFMSYGTVEQGLNTGRRLMQEGQAQAVKLEGGRRQCAVIEALVANNVPVCGHLGLTPQSVHKLGGYKVQGKSSEAAEELLADALAVEAAGAFAIVLECIPAPLAKLVSQRLRIPTIGIGASVDCDGQVLVYQDMLGLNGDFKPKFVKHFADLRTAATAGLKAYVDGVKGRTFPTDAECFTMDESLLDRLY